jgi:hypothetical protein
MLPDRPLSFAALRTCALVAQPAVTCAAAPPTASTAAAVSASFQLRRGFHCSVRRSFAAAAVVPPWPVNPPASSTTSGTPSPSASGATIPATGAPSTAASVTGSESDKSAAVPRSPIATASAAAATAAPATIPSSLGTSVPPFNTFQLVYALRQNGLTEAQAVVLMDALCRVSMDAQEASKLALETTYRADLSALRVAVDGKLAAIEASSTEKLFNAQLKQDMQSKHWREGLIKDTQHEINALKAELAQQRTSAEHERVTLRKELQAQMDKEKALATAEMEKSENKLMRLLVGFVVSASAIGLGAIRLLMR